MTVTPLAAHLPGQGHAETMDAGLGRRIVGLAELATLAVDRGDVDDPTPAPLQHALDDLLGGVEQAIEIGVDHRAPVLQGQLAEGGVTGNASVVHQHVDWADIRLYQLETLVCAVPVADVAIDAVEVVAGLQLLADPVVLASGCGAAADHHGETVTVQASTDRRADPPHSSSDQGDACSTHCIPLLDRKIECEGFSLRYCPRTMFRATILLSAGLVPEGSDSMCTALIQGIGAGLPVC
ncbi:hypothetical protein EC54115_11872 [Escherichia coli 541-15]|nr:hypothetical protein EC54115_11872 [Escherichia coli 541-15]